MDINGLQSRHWLRAIALAGGLTFAAFAPAQTLDFGSCTKIADMSSRLACYDRAAGYSQAGAAPAAPAAPPAAAPPPPPQALVPTAPPLPALPTPGARPAPPAGQPLLGPQATKDPVATFGATDRAAADPLTAKKVEPAKAEPAELKQIEARVTAVRKRPAGEQVVTLDNGQVWTQTESRQQPQIEVGDVVIIKRGMLGSFLLTLQKGSASTRVQRIS